MTHHTSLRPLHPPQHSASAGRDVIMFSKATAARSRIQWTLDGERREERGREERGGGKEGGEQKGGRRESIYVLKMNSLPQLTLTWSAFPG